MRVLERSHGLRRSVSGTLRPREAPQKPRRRPYVVAAFILVVFGAATHVYIDYEAVHAGDVEKAIARKVKKMDRDPGNVVVRVLRRNKGAAEDVARRFQAASPKRVDALRRFDAVEEVRAFSEVGPCPHDEAPQLVNPRSGRLERLDLSNALHVGAPSGRVGARGSHGLSLIHI